MYISGCTQTILIPPSLLNMPINHLQCWLISTPKTNFYKRSFKSAFLHVCSVIMLNILILLFIEASNSRDTKKMKAWRHHWNWWTSLVNRMNTTEQTAALQEKTSKDHLGNPRHYWENVLWTDERKVQLLGENTYLTWSSASWSLVEDGRCIEVNPPRNGFRKWKSAFCSRPVWAEASTPSRCCGMTSPELFIRPRNAFEQNHSLNKWSLTLCRLGAELHGSLFFSYF